MLLFLLTFMCLVFYSHMIPTSENGESNNRSWNNSRVWQFLTSVRSGSGNSSRVLECCPSVRKVFEARATTAADGQVKYFMYYPIVSETICVDGILGSQCLFTHPAVRPYAKCVQQYSSIATYTTPINITGVDFASTDVELKSLAVEYMKYRSGCTCEISASFADSISKKD